MHGGIITSGRAATCAVDAWYWMSWISSFSNTTAPGVTPMLRPTSKPVSSLWLMRFFCTSPSRLARPRVRLSPWVAIAWLSAAGLVAAKFAGLSASTHCRAAKRRRSFATGSSSQLSTSSST